MTVSQALSKEQIEERIKDLSGWSTDGRKIERTYDISHIPGASSCTSRRSRMISDTIPTRRSATAGCT
jgi:pterin-4a-carbinolamine dehydratase